MYSALLIFVLAMPDLVTGDTLCPVLHNCKNNIDFSSPLSF